MSSSYFIETNKNTYYYHKTACYSDLYMELKNFYYAGDEYVKNLNVKCHSLPDSFTYLLVVLWNVFKNFRGTKGIIKNNTKESIMYTKSLNLTLKNQDWNAVVFILFTLRLLDEYQIGYDERKEDQLHRRDVLIRYFISTLPLFKPRESVYLLIMFQSIIVPKLNNNTQHRITSLKIQPKNPWQECTVHLYSFDIKGASIYGQSHWLNSLKLKKLSRKSVDSIFKQQNFNGFYADLEEKEMFKTFNETFIRTCSSGHSDFFSNNSDYFKNSKNPYYDYKNSKIILPVLEPTTVEFTEVEEENKLKLPQVFNYKNVTEKGYLSMPLTQE